MSASKNTIASFDWKNNMPAGWTSASPPNAPESPVNKSTTDVKVPELILSGKDRMGGQSITDLYDQLGMKWDRCPLAWDYKIGKKKGVYQDLGQDTHDKFGNPRNGVLLNCENILVIDIDGDCAKCKEVYDSCDAVCVWKAKTRKGHHFIFKLDPRLKIAKAPKHGVEIDLRTKHGSCLLVEPSFYLYPEGLVQYKWERTPKSLDDLTECPKDVMDWLLTIPDYCEEAPMPKKIAKPKVEKPKVEKPVEKPVEDEKEEEEVEAPHHSLGEIETLCSCLTPEWLADMNNWLRLMMMLKGISASDEMKELFLKHSARAPGYEGYETQNAKAWDGAKPNGRISMGSLKHWAKKCSPEKYFANAKHTYWSLVNQNNANGWCELFYNAMAGDILYSNSHKCYYVYDQRETLWKVSDNNSYINFLFVETTSAVFRKMMGDLPPANDEEEQTKRKSQMKKLTDASKLCGGPYAITLVHSFLSAFCRSDEDPANYFNQNSDLYPLANGVWKFSEKKLIKYEREHYFTFRVPIAYNPMADTTDIRKASLDWFGQDVAVADFIQYYVGYCLTGYTTRQDFMIAWGTKAGNGKSLLWGKILGILLDKYYRTITSDALSTDRVGNNDQLYNLNGGRFAFLSEPRRARGTKIDNEIIKTLTGDESFTAEAKYKNAITFKLQAKFVMACNDMPELKFEDKGTYRRVLIGEQNCEFVDQGDYEKANEKDKADKKILMKDDVFITRLLENVEGLMKWALEGACRFTDNPRMPAPKAMGSAKEKAVSEGDTLGIWIRGNIRNLTTTKDAPADWKKRKITFKRVKEMLATQNENLGQRVPGFNRRLKEKLESFGFQIGGREEKGDQYIKCADEESEPVDDEPVVPVVAEVADAVVENAMMSLKQPTKEEMDVNRKMPTKEQLDAKKRK